VQKCSPAFQAGAEKTKLEAWATNAHLIGRNGISQKASIRKVFLAKNYLLPTFFNKTS